MATAATAHRSRPEAIVDTSSYRDVTVAHDDGAGACETPGAVRVTMTGTTADGGQETIVSQCEVSRVRSSEANEAASAAARDAAQLALPTAGFDPRVRGLVGLRTWLHVGSARREARRRSRSRATRCVLSRDRSQSR